MEKIKKLLPLLIIIGIVAICVFLPQLKQVNAGGDNSNTTQTYYNFEVTKENHIYVELFDSNGFIVNIGDNVLKPSNKYTVKLSTDAGYNLGNVYLNNQIMRLNNNNSFTFTAKKNCYLRVYLSEYYNLVTSDYVVVYDSNNNIVESGNSVLVPNDNYTFTFEIPPSLEIRTWSVQPSSCLNNLNGNSHSFVASENITINLETRIKPYEISIDCPDNINATFTGNNADFKVIDSDFCGGTYGTIVTCNLSSNDYEEFHYYINGKEGVTSDSFSFTLDCYTRIKIEPHNFNNVTTFYFDLPTGVTCSIEDVNGDEVFGEFSATCTSMELEYQNEYYLFTDVKNPYNYAWYVNGVPMYFGNVPGKYSFSIQEIYECNIVCEYKEIATFNITSNLPNFNIDTFFDFGMMLNFMPTNDFIAYTKDPLVDIDGNVIHDNNGFYIAKDYKTIGLPYNTKDFDTFTDNVCTAIHQLIIGHEYTLLFNGYDLLKLNSASINNEIIYDCNNPNNNKSFVLQDGMNLYLDLTVLNAVVSIDVTAESTGNSDYVITFKDFSTGQTINPNTDNFVSGRKYKVIVTPPSNCNLSEIKYYYGMSFDNNNNYNYLRFDLNPTYEFIITAPYCSDMRINFEFRK